MLFVINYFNVGGQNKSKELKKGLMVAAFEVTGFSKVLVIPAR